ncbi:MAG: DUF1887 family protein [Bacteroidales bacterium]|nr:DUF1887 family protein [Bacteroidales bacterium]
MSKTIVNIIDKSNPLPAYLFTKEYYENGDELLFISTEEEADCIQRLAQLLEVEEAFVKSIIVKRFQDKMLYEHICRAIKDKLNTDTHYYLNLAGGSRYMTLSVQHVFENFNTLFFYTQTRENQIVKTIFDNSIYDDDDEVFPIKHRMTLKEYFSLYGLESDVDTPRKQVKETSFSQHLFTMFSQNLLGTNDFKAMQVLRERYRNWNYLNISEAENPTKESMTAIPNLTKFLDYIGFVSEQKGILQSAEMEYLTGGWFEEYVYALIKEVLQPDDIAMGVHISNGVIKHNNELDVCFMKANKLFVIECKTGVTSESLFNEIVYKVCALKEVLLGTSNSYIFSLKKDHKGVWKKTAKYMGITFCDWLNLTKPELLKNILKSMDSIAKENRSVGTNINS